MLRVAWRWDFPPRVLLWTAWALCLVYENRRWPLHVRSCAECLLGFSFLSHNTPTEWPPLLPSSDGLWRYREESDRLPAERGVESPTTWQWRLPSGSHSLTALALCCGHGKGHMLDLSLGKVTSFIKSELETDPPFGVNVDAKIFLCKSQDICCLNSSQGRTAWMPPSTQPRAPLAGRTLQDDLFSFSWLPFCW